MEFWLLFAGTGWKPPYSCIELLLRRNLDAKYGKKNNVKQQVKSDLLNIVAWAITKRFAFFTNLYLW